MSTFPVDLSRKGCTGLYPKQQPFEAFRNSPWVSPDERTRRCSGGRLSVRTFRSPRKAPSPSRRILKRAG